MTDISKQKTIHSLFPVTCGNLLLFIWKCGRYYNKYFTETYLKKFPHSRKFIDKILQIYGTYTFLFSGWPNEIQASSMYMILKQYTTLMNQVHKLANDYDVYDNNGAVGIYYHLICEVLDRERTEHIYNHSTIVPPPKECSIHKLILVGDKAKCSECLISKKICSEDDHIYDSFTTDITFYRCRLCGKIKM